MELQTLPFSVGEIGGVAPFHAQERTSSTYPPRFSKQFLEGKFSETGLPVYGVLGNSKHVWLRFCKTFVIKGVCLFPRSEGGASIRSVGGRLRGGSNGTSKRGQDGADAK